jgi:UDP-glucose 4-epimerase
MATVLVTGGAGFIGSHLVTRLVAGGHAVRVLDDLSTGSMSNLSHLPEGAFEMFRGSVLDRGCASDAVCGDMRDDPVDYILHQAAIPSVPRSVMDPGGTFDANVGGTQSLLEAAVESRLAAAGRSGVKKLIVASSSSVYGGTSPASETTAMSPKSPYAAHKASCEHLCEAYRYAFGLATVCLRYFNVFGPRQDPDSAYSAVIPAFIKSIRAGLPVSIHGDGLQSRDFTYVDNVVDANLLAMSTAMEGVFNVGCGGSHSLLDLVRHLELVLGKKACTVHTEPRAGDVRHSLAVVDKIVAFGYRPRVGLRDGLAKTAEWFGGR